MNEPDIARETTTPTIDDAHISGAINKLLEHPELIGMIGSMLKASPPADAPAEKAVAADAAPTSQGGTDILASLAPMLSRLQSSGAALPHRDDRRECLLLALKPYLSRERCDAIDQMLRISRISDVFKNMSE
jgi:hypothetical protein